MAKKSGCKKASTNWRNSAAAHAFAFGLSAPKPKGSKGGKTRSNAAGGSK